MEKKFQIIKSVNINKINGFFENKNNKINSSREKEYKDKTVDYKIKSNSNFLKKSSSTIFTNREIKKYLEENNNSSYSNKNNNKLSLRLNRQNTRLISSALPKKYMNKPIKNNNIDFKNNGKMSKNLLYLNKKNEKDRKSISSIPPKTLISNFKINKINMSLIKKNNKISKNESTRCLSSKKYIMGILNKLDCKLKNNFVTPKKVQSLIHKNNNLFFIGFQKFNQHINNISLREVYRNFYIINSLSPKIIPEKNSYKIFSRNQKFDPNKSINNRNDITNYNKNFKKNKYNLTSLQYNLENSENAKKYKLNKNINSASYRKKNYRVKNENNNKKNLSWKKCDNNENDILEVGLTNYKLERQKMKNKMIQVDRHNESNQNTSLISFDYEKNIKF